MSDPTTPVEDDPRVKRALDAIGLIFGDTKVSPSRTRALLEEISSDVDARLETLPDDD